MNETRVCKRCRKEKDLESFRNKIASKEPFGKFCAECKEYMNTRYRQDYAKGYFKGYREQREYRDKLFDEELPVGQKRCRTCLNPKPLAEFHVEPKDRERIPGGESRYCIGCREKRNEWMRARREKMSTEKRARQAARLKRIRDGKKARVLEAYGNKCSCCGVAYPEHLTIDHIIKIGSIKRKERGEWGGRFYDTIIKRKFQPGYRCLCWNCNWCIGLHGICAHQKQRDNVAGES